jgi:soluble lytic murein transglycosylase-like protein
VVEKLELTQRILDRTQLLAGVRETALQLMNYNQFSRLVFVITTLAASVSGFAQGVDLSEARLAVASLSYEPTSPSKVPKDWEAWESSTDELIAAVAGSAKRRAYAADIWYESHRAGLDERTIFVLVEMLSRFDAHLVSNFGNIGLLQLAPVVHEKLGNPERSLYQSKYNLRLGCSILKAYLENTKGDLTKALRLFLVYASPQPDASGRIAEFKQLYDARIEQLNKNNPRSKSTKPTQ